MTKIFAHRGASSTHPENTMEAFLAAIAMGADGIELDVRLSKDKTLVVIHDDTLERTTGHRGYVHETSMDELTRLCIPTLFDVLALVQPTDLELNIELKVTGVEDAVLALIHDFNMTERTIISSFDIDTIIALRHRSKEGRLAIIASEYLPDERQWFEELNLDAIHYEKDVFIHKETQLKPSQIRVWTCNVHREIVYLINENVRAIMSDL